MSSQPLNKIVSFLDDFLENDSVVDKYSPNGLQVEGSERVEKVGFCVDAALQTFQQLEDCQMIIVHHGLFWPSFKRVDGVLKKQLSWLLSRDISLYASHLPLDVHRGVGNNIQLINKLNWELEEEQTVGPVGYLARCPEQSPKEILQEVEALTDEPARLLDFGLESVDKVAVSSGAAGPELLLEAKKRGAQMLLTGESSHPIYHAAQQEGMNVILAGHYATETWGVKALMPCLEEKFGLSTTFVDCRTGF